MNLKYTGSAIYLDICIFIYRQDKFAYLLIIKTTL